MTIIEMRSKYAALSDEVKAMTGRSLTPEEQTGFDVKCSEMEELRKGIDREERAAKLLGFNASISAEPPKAEALEGENRSAIKTRERILDKPFSLGEKCLAIRSRMLGTGSDPRLDRELEERAIVGANEGQGNEGGFLVGTQSSDLMKKTFELSPIMQMVRKQTVGAGFNGVDWTDVAETSRKNTYRNGGVLGYWMSEGDEIDATTIKWQKNKLELDEVAALLPATGRMLEDATALESKINEVVPKELAFQCQRGIVAGTGAGMPYGLTNSAAMVSITAEGGQGADTILFENVLKMRSRILPSSLSSGKVAWLYNPDTFPQLSTMVMTSGVSSIPVWMPANGIQGQPYDTLYGRPAIPCELCPALGDAGDLMLVDLDEYLWIDKGGIKSDLSIHVYFTTNQTLFRFIYRASGMPTYNSAVTAYNGSVTYSPYLNIAAR